MLEIDSKFQNKFNKIYIDQATTGSKVAQRFMNLFPDKCEVIQGPPPNYTKGELSSEQFAESKKQVHITNFQGQFFKKCPGFHKGMACCNYFVLNLGFQCDMDCSYCYLQSFINSNYLTIYANVDMALEELKQMEHLKGQPMRVGTGEVIDSLSLDPLTLYSHDLIQFFKDYPTWKLEFKTKSAYVDQFLDCDHAGNVIVSWSINPQNIIAAEEHGTASFEERIQAARKCVDKGYQVSFHIDPMIWHQGWEKNYKTLVDRITTEFQPKDIPYLSVGALRFQPEQKNIMRERFGMKSLVNQGETFKSQDGKLRYDYSLRQSMFEFILKGFRNHSKEWKIFMCMETPETWVDTFGHNPFHEEPLRELFKPIRA